MVTRALLTRFLDGKCSPEELALLKQYFLSAETSEFDQMVEEDWKAAEKDVPNQEFDNHRERILIRLKHEWRRSGPSQLGREESIIGHIHPIWKRSVAAAVVLFVLTIGSMIFLHQSENVRESFFSSVVMLERKNDRSEPMRIVLPDGSSVLLEPRSTLCYPEKFNVGKRIVRLEGQAFFDVAKDSLNPFFVKTRTLNVRVIGTSFNITSFQDQPAEVSVLTGKVAVSVAKRKESLILTRNERVIQQNETDKLTKVLVKEPVMLKNEILAGQFDFNDTPVTQVFAVLERAYQINILYNPSNVKNRTLKARLGDQPLFVKLDMICASLDLEYEIIGTEILIKENTSFYQEK